MPNDMLKIALPEIAVTAVHASHETDERSYTAALMSRMEELGFTMQGGVFVELTMTRADGTPVVDYVRVARRFRPLRDEPSTTLETRMPEFMNYLALRNEYAGATNWGAELINTMIAANGGNLPASWLDAALMTAEAGTSTH